jgi:hypothetical protein
MNPLPEDEIADLSFRIAKAVARKMGILDFREIVGAVWQGVNRAAVKGISGGMLQVAGQRSTIDYLREAGACGLSRGDFARGVRVEQLGVSPARAIPCRESGLPPEARMEEFWDDTRDLRALATMRQRVAAYLHFACGWTQTEVSEAMGVSQSSINHTMEAFRKNVAEKVSHASPER